MYKFLQLVADCAVIMHDRFNHAFVMSPLQFCDFNDDLGCYLMGGEL